MARGAHPRRDHGERGRCPSGPLAPWPAPRALLPLLPLVLLLLAAASAPLCAHARSWATSQGYRFIDCGAEEGEGYVFRLDDGSMSGVTYQINGTSNTSSLNATEHPLLSEAERSLRSFPEGQGCYIVELPVEEGSSSNYTLRLGFAYYNYDGKSAPPSFMVSLNDLEYNPINVDTISLSLWEDESGNPETAPMGGGVGEAHYVEYVFDGSSGSLVVCLTSNDPPDSTLDFPPFPVLNTLEIMPLPPGELQEGFGLVPFLKTMLRDSSVGVMLSLKHRMNLGGDTVKDEFNRTWHAESDRSDYYSLNQPNGVGLGHENISTAVPVHSGNMQLPQGMLQTAWRSNSTDGQMALSVNYYPQYSVGNPILARLYFASLDPTATNGSANFSAYLTTTAFSSKSGDIISNNIQLDIVSLGNAGNGTFAAVMLPLLGCTQSTDDSYTTVWVTVAQQATATQAPFLNGVELWEVVGTAGDLCPLGSAPNPAPWTAPVTSPSTYYVPLPGGKKMSAGVIVGIILAIVTGLVLIGAVVVLIRGRRKEQKQTLGFQRFESEVHLAEVRH